MVADGWVPGRLEEDWAIVELEDPVGQSAGWVPMGKPEPGAPLGQLGYRAESAHAMSLDYGCAMLAADQRFLWDDCEAAHGDSGGPLFAFLPEGPRLIGITVVARPCAGKDQHRRGGDYRHPGPEALSPMPPGWSPKSIHSPGHKPPSGGPVATQPAATVAALDGGRGTPPTLANLARLLAAPPAIRALGYCCGGADCGTAGTGRQGLPQFCT